MATKRAPYDPEHDGKTAAWAVIWILFAFKMATVLLILYPLRTTETALILGATTWYWLPLVGFAIAGPLLFRYRLRRVRAKRDQLRRAEWMLTQDQDIDERAGTRR